ncbi:MAG: Hsp20 family protein [Kofleriaceae bacterium]|nr:Hsp20 family protein [Kofleriaceae bacterium]
MTGKREHEEETKGDTIYTCERSSGSFSRAFTLPAGVDAEHCRNELEDGVLTLAMPKRPEAQAKKIPVAVGKAKS